MLLHAGGLFPIYCLELLSPAGWRSLCIMWLVHNNYFFMCVQLDVTFPALACSVVSLDAMDISGEQHLDVVSVCPFSSKEP